MTVNDTADICVADVNVIDSTGLFACVNGNVVGVFAGMTETVLVSAPELGSVGQPPPDGGETGHAPQSAVQLLQVSAPLQAPSPQYGVAARHCVVDMPAGYELFRNGE